MGLDVSEQINFIENFNLPDFIRVYIFQNLIDLLNNHIPVIAIRIDNV